MEPNNPSRPDHPQSWGEAQDDRPDHVTDPQAKKRPKNREVENENLKVPSKEGTPPRPATEPGR